MAFQTQVALAIDHPNASFISRLGDLARPIAKQFFRARLDVELKDDESPVTRADRDIEALLRHAVRHAFPMDGLYGEEHGILSGESESLWVIDPIDGTKAFISGMPTFGTLIAQVQAREVVLGMIDMPALNERWIGAKGYHTTFGGLPCHTRKGIELGDAMVYATSPDMFRGDDLKRFDAVCGRAALRRFGGDCYAYALLASGHVDAVVETGLKPYDYLALVPIIEGAGGCITDWSGKPLGLCSRGDVVAAGTPSLHAEILALLTA